jgi:hypothetical protein
VILFHDDLNSPPDLSQHGSDIFHQFGLGHVEYSHTFDDSC